jgi:uncharacterized protein (TIGR02145 family)
MKKLITICAAILITTFVFAQAPNKMSYQAVIRNSSNALINNQLVGMKISILQNSPTGNAVYVETQIPTTNANGLASIEIGGGAVVSGNFSSINWASGPFFCKTETDPTGGTSYTITATSQLLSVPYAMFSGNGITGVSTTGDSLVLGNGTSIIIPGISAANNTGSEGGIVSNPGAGVTFNGYLYSSIVLGNGQEWMAENLRTSTYANGDPIPNITDNTQWSNLNTGAWVYYNNNIQYENPYGKLYNWFSVADARNLCPAGWHVPTDQEWTFMTDYLGGENVAGGKLKKIGTSNWFSPNYAGNESGFTALPSGQRILGGQFVYIDSNFYGSIGLWWTSSEYTDQYRAWRRNLSHEDITIGRDVNFKDNGMAVRCLKN